ncbi:gypsy retrotransposon integrase 1-like protein [Plakobranchus ocellatus]|uniref:Gypsy retrotransposon integrase 1-like protein n=1 Tax=Plakobranchus ocellatus TaxID=259542 RepID=A0AAV3Y634_9GAST|nr:gypsy retrotransposon integrase 1-like protein [Plakobranchus ocellatus]
MYVHRKGFLGTIQDSETIPKSRQDFDTSLNQLTKLLEHRCHFFQAKANKEPCIALRDKGCNCSAVNQRLLPPETYTGSNKQCTMFDRFTIELQTAGVHISSPFFTGLRFFTQFDRQPDYRHRIRCECDPLESYIRHNKNDPGKSRKLAASDQLIVPTTLRNDILSLCHDTLTSGHLGVTATKERNFVRFSCPNITRYIKTYFGSRHKCQMYAPRLSTLPTQEMEVISKPFEKVSIDITGPCSLSENRIRFALTLTDSHQTARGCTSARHIHRSHCQCAFSTFSPGLAFLARYSLTMDSN